MSRSLLDVLQPPVGQAKQNNVSSHVSTSWISSSVAPDFSSSLSIEKSSPGQNSRAPQTGSHARG